MRWSTWSIASSVASRGERGVDADPVEPRRERRVALESAQSAIRADEDVLRKIAGVLVGAHEPVAKLIDLALMASHDDVEGVAAPGKAGVHQRLIARCAQRVVRSLVVRPVARHAHLPAGLAGPPETIDRAVQLHSVF
jgi:hypothetical protein